MRAASTSIIVGTFIANAENLQHVALRMLSIEGLDGGAANACKPAPCNATDCAR